MRLWVKILIGAALVLLIGPFLIPVPPVAGVPAGDLADRDSRFTEINGIQVHYKLAGEGEPAVLLLHGFGASVFSWRDVLKPLAEYRKVVAFDRPAFGLTERPLKWQGENPYSMEAQVNLTLGLMDELGLERAILIGHSAGGAVAVETALAAPDRIAGLVLVAPALEGYGLKPWARVLLNLPQVRRLGPLLVRAIASRGTDLLNRAWYDQDTLSQEVAAGYKKPLQADNWDRALWEYTRASESVSQYGRLDDLTMPVLVITGDSDQVVPPEKSRAAAKVLGVEAVVFANCGHLPQEEFPAQFTEVVLEFLKSIE